MKRTILSLLALWACVLCYAQEPQQARKPEELKLTLMKDVPQQVYLFRSWQGDPLTLENGRLNSFAPLYLIYPDQPCNEEQSLALIRELGIDRQMEQLSLGVGVVNPVGAKYDAARDWQAYQDMITALRVVTNLKLIGVGQGATFVNTVIAPKAAEVAGIVSIDGRQARVSKDAAPVPAFITGKNAAKVAQAYIAAAGAVLVSAQGQTKIYENPAEPLLRVVVNTGNPSKADLMAEAWDNLLSRNYRFNNYDHTFYEGQKHGEHGLYELEPFLMLDKLGVERRIVVQGEGRGQALPTLWYEYIPKGVLDAPAKSVPLVLLLHGNNNDPRTQADTSGWIQLAASEKFMVAELEWQGKPGYAAMGHDGIEETVLTLLGKYPQLDASRVYTEGLSAGAMTSSALGVKKSHLFAAIGAMSGGMFGGRGAYGSDAVMDEATQKRGFVETAYIGVFGTADNVIRYPKPGDWKGNSVIHAWEVYQTMNGLEVFTNYDFNLDAAFGRTLADRRTVATPKGISMEMGEIYKGNVPLMRLVAVNGYGHWNFQPAAAVMWDFFKHFSRDTATKKLIYHP